LRSDLVIDASVALAWCFPDERTDQSSRVLDELRQRRGIVPGIWPLEVTNAILAGERRKRVIEADVSRFFALLSQLSLTVDVLTAQQSFANILPLARAHGLSAYDASYLELAMREGCTLATLDAKLRKAAKASGVAVFPDK
jgi:predicted nucleic acid-binding protein